MRRVCGLAVFGSLCYLRFHIVVPRSTQLGMVWPWSLLKGTKRCR